MSKQLFRIYNLAYATAGIPDLFSRTFEPSAEQAAVIACAVYDRQTGQSPRSYEDLFEAEEKPAGPKPPVEFIGPNGETMEESIRKLVAEAAIGVVADMKVKTVPATTPDGKVAFTLKLDPKVSEPAPKAAQTLRDLDEQVKTAAIPTLHEKLEAAAIAKKIETRIDQLLFELGRPSGQSTAASEFIRELVVRELVKKNGGAK